MKYVVVSGGVVSGLGKGVTASSVGVLLKASGLRVTSVKIDPYINIDAGTMSPFEHGETYVLDDGGESDLDLGNYERFVDVSLTRDHNITTGKVYQVRACVTMDGWRGARVRRPAGAGCDGDAFLRGFFLCVFEKKSDRHHHQQQQQRQRQQSSSSCRSRARARGVVTDGWTHRNDDAC